jgi:hypothetical protein
MSKRRLLKGDSKIFRGFQEAAHEFMRQCISVFYMRWETIGSPMERDFSKPYVGFGRE